MLLAHTLIFLTYFLIVSTMRNLTNLKWELQSNRRALARCSYLTPIKNKKKIYSQEKQYETFLNIRKSDKLFQVEKPRAQIGFKAMTLKFLVQLLDNYSWNTWLQLLSLWFKNP